MTGERLRLIGNDISEPIVLFWIMAEERAANG
jgi:hypothetical protein